MLKLLSCRSESFGSTHDLHQPPCDALCSIGRYYDLQPVASKLTSAEITWYCILALHLPPKTLSYDASLMGSLFLLIELGGLYGFLAGLLEIADDLVPFLMARRCFLVLPVPHLRIREIL